MIPAQVQRGGAWQSAVGGLIDSGAEVNLVSHILAKECGWEPAAQRHTIVAGIDGRPMRSNQTYSVAVKLEDSWGNTREATHTFHAVESAYYPIVFGYPWLRREDPHIRWAAKTWRFEIEKEDIEVLAPAEFQKHAGATSLTLKKLESYQSIANLSMRLRPRGQAHLLDHYTTYRRMNCRF